MLGINRITAGRCGVQPVTCLLQFTIGIGKLAEKMSRIAAFGPCLSDVSADTARTSPDLIREGETFLHRPEPRDSKYLLLELKGLLVNLQIPKTLRQSVHFVFMLFFETYRRTAHCRTVFRRCGAQTVSIKVRSVRVKSVKAIMKRTARTTKLEPKCRASGAPFPKKA